MSQATEPLRVCRVCGLEAHSEEDLGDFAKNKTSAYGHQNICLKCLHEETKERSHRIAVDDPPGSARCRVCGRLLRVAESVDRGIGPVCWSRMQHNHNLEEYPKEAELLEEIEDREVAAEEADQG